MYLTKLISVDKTDTNKKLYTELILLNFRQILPEQKQLWLKNIELLPVLKNPKPSSLSTRHNTITANKHMLDMLVKHTRPGSNRRRAFFFRTEQRSSKLKKVKLNLKNCLT